MITKEELLKIPKGTKLIIQWDKSKIVEILERRKGLGNWGFFVYNVISKEEHYLYKHYTSYSFTILPSDRFVRLGDLIPKNYFTKKFNHPTLDSFKKKWVVEKE